MTDGKGRATPGYVFICAHCGQMMTFFNTKRTITWPDAVIMAQKHGWALSPAGWAHVKCTAAVAVGSNGHGKSDIH